MAERKPLRASLKAGDRLLIPSGRVDDEYGSTIKIIYDELLIADGSCRVEYLGVLHVRVSRSCNGSDFRHNTGNTTN